jgi:hypothetical protein
MDKSPEVLVYLQTLKSYIENNQEAKDYFLLNYDEESFFDLVGDIAQANFDKRGEPQLTQRQLEFVRITLHAFKRADESDDNLIFDYKSNNINFYLK